QKALTAPELIQFNNFLVQQQNVVRWAPDTYIFAKDRQDETQLTLDQQNVLAAIRTPTVCTFKDTLKTPPPAPAKPGDILSTSDDRAISGNGCPLNDATSVSMTLFVTGIDQQTKNPNAFQGTIAYSNSLSADAGATYAKNAIGAGTSAIGTGKTSMS